MTLKGFLFFILMGWGTPFALAEKPQTLHWVVLNFPPIITVPSDGGFIDIHKTTGPMADIHRELEKALPQYNHLYMRASFERAKRYFESHQGYCTLLFLPSEERRQYLLFGETIVQTAPPGIVIGPKSLSKVEGFTHNGRVDLSALMKSKDFALGLVDGRSFSEETNKVLREPSARPYKLVDDQALSRLFMMLKSGRLDGILAYYLELKDHNEKFYGKAISPFRFLPITQNPEILSLPVSCEKSPWGQKTLRAISKAVQDPTVKKRLTDLTRRTMPPSLVEQQEAADPSLLR